MCRHKVFLKVCIFVAVICSSTFCFSNDSFAQIILNEVMPAPSQGDEWVELKNISSQSASLAGWQLEDNSGALSPLPSFSSSVIPAGEYLVFEIKNRLNNSGDQLLLRRPDNFDADFFEYSSSTTDLSWSRKSDLGTEFFQTQPTRGSVNLVPSPSPSPSANPTPQPSPFPTPNVWLSPFPTPASPLPSPAPLASHPLQLSEIVACPQTNEHEWIEFFNPNTVNVTISNWKIKDNSGNSRNLIVSITAQSFATIDLSSAILNNDGDTAFILDANGNTLIEVELGNCIKGESTVFVDGSWRQTTTPTKNGVNTFLPIEQESTADSDPLSLDTLVSESVQSTPGASFTNSQQLPPSFSAEATQASSSVVLGTKDDSTENTDDSFVSSALPQPTSFLFQKPFLISLFVSSVLAMGIGGYGLYQWYTERRAESLLETL